MSACDSIVGGGRGALVRLLPLVSGFGCWKAVLKMAGITERRGFAFVAVGQLIGVFRCADGSCCVSSLISRRSSGKIAALRIAPPLQRLTLSHDGDRIGLDL